MGEYHRRPLSRPSCPPDYEPGAGEEDLTFVMCNVTPYYANLPSDEPPGVGPRSEYIGAEAGVHSLLQGPATKEGRNHQLPNATVK